MVSAAAAAALMLGVSTAYGQDLPAVARSDATREANRDAQAASEYRLQAGDTVLFKFFYNPELNETMPIRPDGRVSLQLVGELQAAGLTPAGLADVLRERYKGFLRSPDVTVIVKEMSTRRVFVAGEVNVPGLVPMPGRMTVVQSLAQAGGAKRSGKLSDVVVLRYDGTTTPRFIKLDVDQALKGKNAKADLPLEPMDIVFVPKTRVAAMDDFVDQYIRQLIPIPLSFGITYFFPR